MSWWDLKDHEFAEFDDHDDLVAIIRDPAKSPRQRRAHQGLHDRHYGAAALCVYCLEELEETYLREPKAEVATASVDISDEDYEKLKASIMEQTENE